jgi:fructose-1-phosphate kinase PfkB-like protein
MNVISTVGCGDATLAGFALAASQDMSAEETVRLAGACGAANSVAFAPGRIEKVKVLELLPKIEVRKLNF